MRQDGSSFSIWVIKYSMPGCMSAGKQSSNLFFLFFTPQLSWGKQPSTIQQRSIPNAQISALKGSYSFLLTSSGDMQQGVPAILTQECSPIIDSPMSITFISPYSFINTFSGLRSRWAIRMRWRYATAQAICFMMDRRVWSGRGRWFLAQVERGTLLKCYITILIVSLVSQKSIIRIMLGCFIHFIMSIYLITFLRFYSVVSLNFWKIFMTTWTLSVFLVQSLTFANPPSPRSYPIMYSLFSGWFNFTEGNLTKWCGFFLLVVSWTLKNVFLCISSLCI